MPKPLAPSPPLRVWSLIVTIFGDVVMERGTNPAPQPVWIAPLLDLLALLDIDAGLARTNFSRLVANGTLLRDKAGRNTFYRLSPASRDDFIRAAAVIYRHEEPRPTGFFHLALIDHCPHRPTAKQMLEARDFRFVTPAAASLPEHEGRAPPPLPQGAIPALAPASAALLPAVREAWQIDQLAEGYRDFMRDFAHLGDEAPATPAAAVAARVRLVHHFRRLALRDPGLAASALPENWQGTAARRLFTAASAMLHETSELWLRATGLRT